MPGGGCPGLDLHFWRKICRSCRCSKDAHDVQDDELPGWAQFELLGNPKPKRAPAVVLKIRGIADEPVKLDWVPPDISSDMVSDYMSCLGGDLAPVVGSEGAAKRRQQLRRQIPLHDIRSDLCCHTLTPQEQTRQREYVSRIKSHAVGQGNIVRIGTIKKGDVLSINAENSQPAKSYSLPLKVSSVSDGVKYSNVPKSTSDKLLVLDNMGNVINKSGHLLDYMHSSLLSPVVKQKLSAMNIESDRIKSAVEHGPVYDKLFKHLKHLNFSVDRDVYLCPIRRFRFEYNTNPKFKDETAAFAESQGAKAMTTCNALNNNAGFPVDSFPSQHSYPQKGTIFAPNGEIWGWSSTDSVGPSYAPPPLPNYNTHPQNVVKNMARSHNANPEFAETSRIQSQIGAMTENVGNMTLMGSETCDSNGDVPCQRCRRPIQQGDVAVKAQRAGENASWHPQCFACFKCDQLLADLVYFYHKGEIYCARDLAQALKIMRCAACDELIFSKVYTMAEDRVFHETHFCCYHCDSPMGNQHYVPDDKTGLPICLSCYDHYHAQVCRLCKMSIGPQQQGVSWSSLHWHSTCFFCSNQLCRKSMLHTKFVVKQDMPFCSAACVRTLIN